jgi:hypothetical protein
MAGFAIKGFGGMFPRQNSRLLPEAAAEEAVNVDLSAGTLAGLPTPLLVKDLTASAAPVLRAYRFPGPEAADPDVWLPLPSPFSSVVRSPLANDTLNRIYWTNPPGTISPTDPGGAKWNTYTGIAAGTPAFDLGFITPDGSYTPTVTAAGGTDETVTPYVERSYLVTFVDAYGAESSPCSPSTTVAGASDGTWTILMKTTAPPAVAGFNYPPTQGCYLYRTVTSASSGAQFYRVAEFNFSTNPPPVGGYIDGTLDADVVANPPLQSSLWSPPLAGLDGLISMPGGFLVGFTGNTLHFSEVDYPHTWPAEYDLSCQYQIVGLALWQQSLVVLTKGYPQTGTGTAPSNFTLSAINVPEPCISRGSVVTDLLGVYYASQNGLVMLNYYGMTNQTLTMVTKNEWLTTYNATDIIACRHRAQYLAIRGTGTGFLIDYTEPRLGMVDLSTFEAVSCVWNDVYTGTTYIISGQKVYEWDAPSQAPLMYRWRSKEFYLPAPTNFGAMQISMSTDVLTPPDPTTPPLSNSDPTLVLPTGVNATCSVYAHGVLMTTVNLTSPRSIFRLPSGFKVFDWQFEIVSTVEIYGIEVAETMQELKRV